MRSRCRCRLLVCLPVLLWLSAPLAADEAAEAISQLLDAGWGITLQARAAADKQLPEMLKRAADDAKSSQAVWLVLMQQRRFDEALRRLDEHHSRWPDDLLVLRAKTWILTVVKNYPVAFVTADRLSTTLAAAPKDDAERAAQEDAIGFLGRLAGYFGGPIADSINQEERKAWERKWLARLAESQRSVFEDARNGVLARYIEMTDESADARERALATAKTEKERTLADVQAEREQVAAKTKELDERRDKLNAEFKSELDDIARQDQPLAQQLGRLGAQVGNLNTDLLNYQTQIATLGQLAARERNGSVLQQQYLAQANALSLVAGQVEANLIAANTALQSVRSQRAGLAARRNQAQANTNSQVDRLDRELAELGKRERRSDGIEKRASRPASASTSKVRSLAAQAAAFSTYDAFPLEAVKAQLLESLR